jgi:hypothetical protein
MAEFVPMRIQARFNIPQTFASRYLGISQTKELTGSCKGFDPVLFSIAANTEIKGISREKPKSCLN